jgi:ABC-type uncharacterized transport system ATPase component
VCDGYCVRGRTAGRFLLTDKRERKLRLRTSALLRSAARARRRVRKRELVSLLGPNGTGKSTTLRIVVGIQPGDAGRIWVDETEVTERPEAVKAGTVQLVGANAANIVEKVSTLLTDEDEYLKMSRAHNPYGDGTASEKIGKALM